MRAPTPPPAVARMVNADAAIAKANRMTVAATIAAQSTKFKLSAREQADRILATILNSKGPIVLVVPGTNGRPYEHANYETVHSLLKHINGPAVVTNIPYDNSVIKAVQRFFHINVSNGSSIIGFVLEGINKYAPHRPVYVVGESQGSWVIADELRNKRLAAMVKRVVFFSTPGFVKVPSAVGDAIKGADNADSGVLKINHTDDIVPGLLFNLNIKRVTSILGTVLNGLGGGDFDYTPHYYDQDGAAAGAFLATGRRPKHPNHQSEHESE